MTVKILLWSCLFLCLRVNQRAHDDWLNLCHSTAHQVCCIANVSMPCRLVDILSADRQEIRIVNLVAQVFAAPPSQSRENGSSH